MMFLLEEIPFTHISSLLIRHFGASMFLHTHPKQTVKSQIKHSRQTAEVSSSIHTPNIAQTASLAVLFLLFWVKGREGHGAALMLQQFLLCTPTLNFI